MENFRVNRKFQNTNKKGASDMTDMQRCFCDEYLVDMNARQAALRAGYKKNTAKNAVYWINYEIDQKQVKQGHPSQYRDYMRKYIDQRLAEKEDALIAKQDEVLKYLSSVLRGESRSAEVVVVGTGGGCAEAQEVQKAPSEKERLKAAELLGKAYGTFTERIEAKTDAELTISIDYGGGDESEDQG